MSFIWRSIHQYGSTNKGRKNITDSVEWITLFICNALFTIKLSTKLSVRRFKVLLVPTSSARSGTHLSGSQTAWSCDSSSSRVALVASRWEDPVQAVVVGSQKSQVASGTHLRPSDIGCQYSRSIYTARFIVWQPRRAADTSTNWRQSLLCCCTASMEQAADGAETAAIDGLVSSWSEDISVSFCLRSPGYGLTLWCALGRLVGGTI